MALRCLIVDDNPAFVAAARAILEGAELTMAGDATNTVEALALADQISPDVILLDIDLGGESGLDLAWELDRRAGGRLTHIVLISAYPEDDFADLIAEAPAVGFVGKSQLSVTAVVDLVRRDRPHGETQWEFR